MLQVQVQAPATQHSLASHQIFPTQRQSYSQAEDQLEEHWPPPSSVRPTGRFPGGPIESTTVGTNGPIAPTACPPVPVITVTQSISFTETITAPVIPPIGTAPLPSASFSSAPFPVPGNGTLSRGPTSTGTGLLGTGLPGTGLLGTGTSILPTFMVPAKSATLDLYYK